jgi:hypothetical protein
MTEQDQLRTIIEEQVRRYHGFGIEDLYKLVYQATCGGGHLIKNRVKAKRVLQKEWLILGRLQRGERLLEIIDPLGKIVRVNLRIYKKMGGQLQRFFTLFVESSKLQKEDKPRLNRYWNDIITMSEAGEIAFSSQQLVGFWKRMEEKGLPPISHSEGYVEYNRPAYRVIQKQLWEGFQKQP